MNTIQAFPDTPSIFVIPSATGFSIRHDSATQIQYDTAKEPVATSFPHELAFLPVEGGWTLDKAEELARIAEQLCDSVLDDAYDRLVAAEEDEDEDLGDTLRMVTDDEDDEGHGPEELDELPEHLL
jgi:hypothetical protein